MHWTHVFGGIFALEFLLIFGRAEHWIILNVFRWHYIALEFSVYLDSGNLGKYLTYLVWIGLDCVGVLCSFFLDWWDTSAYSTYLELRRRFRLNDIHYLDNRYTNKHLE